MRLLFKRNLSMLNSEELKHLTREVKEIIAGEILQRSTKRFTETDLWNIRRKSKVTRIRKWL